MLRRKWRQSSTDQFYALFLVYTHELFEDALVVFQAEEPKIHTLHRSVVKLIRNIVVRFVKPSALKGKPVHEVQYKLHYSIHTSKDILIGNAARDFINNKQNNRLREEFFRSAIAYFQSLCDLLFLTLPLCLKQEDDHLLKDVEVATPTCRHHPAHRASPACLSDSPASFHLVSPSRQSWNSLECTSKRTLCMAERIDNTWSAVGNLKDETGEQTMKELSKGMCGILTVSHSSAHCERVFSCVRKKCTDQRSSLGDDTLESLLVLKAALVPELTPKMFWTVSSQPATSHCSQLSCNQVYSIYRI